MNNKIKTLDQIASKSLILKKQGKIIVLCHGVFDLLHLGHIEYLNFAKSQGDILIVTVTENKYINKGPNRPVFNDQERCKAISALECVDFVAINKWPTAVEIIKKIQPNIYCKGKDYKEIKSDKTGKIKDEIKAVKKINGKIIFSKTKIFSSSSILNKYDLVLNSEQKKFLNNLKKEFNYKNYEKIIDDLKNKKILVIGEIILDEYVFCEALGKSGKEPVLTMRPVKSEKYLGGVASVANHLSSFVKEIKILSMVGEKLEHHKFLMDNLKKNIKLDVIKKKNSTTIVKRRYIESFNQNKLLGVYQLDDENLRQNEEKNFQKKLEKNIPNYDVVITIDYGHGLLSKKSIKTISKLSKFSSLNAQINSSNIGYHNMLKYKNFDMVIINESEIRHHFRNRTEKTVKLIKSLMKSIKCKNIAVTQGKAGVVMCSTTPNKIITCPAFASEVIDKIGSGDAMLSILSLLISSKIDKNFSLLSSSLAAAFAVENIGNKHSYEKKYLLKTLQHILN